MTLGEARAVIAAQFSHVDTGSMEHLGSGWQFDAYLTSDRWAFRFPRQAWSADLFEPERRVHELVAPVLPSRVAIPFVELVGEPSELFPYRFAGHRFIPGIPIDAVDPAQEAKLAAEIGAALSAIHSIPEGQARVAGVLEPDPGQEGRREWLRSGLEGARGLVGLHPTVDQAVGWVSGLSSPLPRYGGPLRFIHQDLSPEHLLVEPETAELVGILDWTDAALGDPARDFVTLVTSRGWRFADEVLKNYTLPIGPTFRVRLTLLVRLLSILWLAHAHARETDVSKHVTWVINAFSAARS